MLQELLEEEADIENQWQKVKGIFTSTCQEVLGPKRHQRKEWISGETMRKVQERKLRKAAVNDSRTRAAKAKAQKGYTEANREVKKVQGQTSASSLTV